MLIHFMYLASNFFYKFGITFDHANMTQKYRITTCASKLGELCTITEHVGAILKDSQNGRIPPVYLMNLMP